jgi:hypothetical protein
LKDILPPKIPAGVTFERCVSLCDYPAPDWTLSAYLRGPSAIDFTSSADGSSHKFSVDASDTSEWAAGIYSYVVRAAKGGDVRQVEAGTLEITPDLATVSEDFDGRSQNRRTLDAINAVLEKRASRDQERYTINNRELWRTPIGDLLKLQAHYQALVRTEERAARGKSKWGPAVQVRL